MKKLLTIALVAAATVATVSTTTACGTKLTDINADKVTVWSPFASTGNNKAHLELVKMADDFNATNPEKQVEIVPIEGSYDGVSKKMAHHAAANAGLPNVWLGYADSAGMMGTWGALQDLEEIKKDGKTIIDSSVWVDSFVEESKSVGNKLHGVPYYKTAEVGFVNLSLIKHVMGHVNTDPTLITAPTAPANWAMQANGRDFTTWVNTKLSTNLSDTIVTVNGTAKLVGDAQIKFTDLDTMEGMKKIANVFKNFDVKVNNDAKTYAIGIDSLTNFGMAQTFNAAGHNYGNYFLNKTNKGAEITLANGKVAAMAAYDNYREIIRTGRGWSTTPDVPYSSGLFSANKMALAIGSTAGAGYQVSNTGTTANDLYITSVPGTDPTKKTVVQQGPSIWATNVGSDAVQRSMAAFLQFTSGTAYQVSNAKATGSVPTTKAALDADSQFVKDIKTTLDTISSDTNTTTNNGAKAAALAQKTFIEFSKESTTNQNTILFVPPVNNQTDALRNQVIGGAYGDAYARLLVGNYTADQFWANIESKYKQYVA